MPAAVIQSGRRIGSNPGAVRRKLHPLALGRASVSGCPEQLRKAEPEAEEKGFQPGMTSPADPDARIAKHFR